MGSETYTINLGDITFDYSSTSSDIITLDHYEPDYTNPSTVTIDTSTGFDVIDWFEDQRIEIGRAHV